MNKRWAIRMMPITPTTMFTLLFILVWSGEILTAFLRAAISKCFGGYYWVGDLFIAILVIFLIVASYKHWSRDIQVKDFFFPLAFCIVYLLCMDSKNIQLYKYLNQTAVKVLLMNLPCFMLGIAYKESMLPTICKVSTLSIYLYILYKFTINTSYDNYMSAAYALLPHVMIVIYWCFAEFNVFKLLTAIAGSLFLVILGCRGPVVFLILFLIIVILLQPNGSKKKRFISIFISLYIAVLAYILQKEIMVYLLSLSKALGANNRIIDMLQTARFLVSTGREEINVKLINVLKSLPLFGYGIAGDRIFTGVDSYAHNLLIELLISYGWILGLTVFAAIIALIVRVIIAYRRSENLYFFLAVAFSGGFLKLFISSSYLLEPFFFLLLGLCVNAIRGAKENDEYALIEER